MNDAFGLPNKGVGNTWFFGPSTGTIARGVQVWHKPRGACMCLFVVWSGGGGGGAGRSKASGTAGGGGGGGACSGIARFIVQAAFVPEKLFIQVGHGGVGGRPGVSGTAGIQTYITTCPPLTAGTVAPQPNIWLNSNVNAPGGGGSSTSTSGGTAGSVASIAVIQPHHVYGQWSATVGLVGIVGGAGAGANGGAITAWAAHPFSPGASGGGCTTTDFAGGVQTATARYSVPGFLEVAAGAGALLPGGVADGGNGNAGIRSLAPFMNCGGSGGGTNANGQGGHGGNGGYGCGGGGGGAGTTGGNGGNGGPGGAIIVCW